MFKVESKYINPDHYIARLKKQLQEASDRSTRWYQKYIQRMGIVICKYSPNSEHRISITNQSLGELDIDDEIMIVGKIIKTAKYIGDKKKKASEAYINLEKVVFIKKDEK